MNIVQRKNEAVDQLALCMDLVRTAQLALQDKSMLDNRAIDAVANVLDHALENLAPIYSMANRIQGEGKL